MDVVNSILTNGWVLAAWLALALLCSALLVRDIARCNAHIGSLMKAVWFLTVLYSGPLGLAIYFYSGRGQIRRDSLWRKGFRSVAHCYSGCGAGEITGVFIAAGILALGNWPTALITFAFAYLFGYAMTIGPLMQDGAPFKEAFIDTFYAETATIAVMEITAIGLDLWLAGGAAMTEVLFWTSLIVSLSAGLVVAYPVNVILIHLGVKGAMANPRQGREEAAAE